MPCRLRPAQAAFASSEDMVCKQPTLMIPKAPTPRLRDGWLVHLRIAQVLSELCPILNASGVRWLVVKGAALARNPQLYSDPAERPLADLDLRIRPQDLQRTEQALTQAGAKLIERAPAYGNLVAELHGQCIDVEAYPCPPYTSRLTIADLLERAYLTEMNPGPSIWVPETTDHALLLAANLIKDKLHYSASWSRRDTHRIADTPTFDAELLVARATRYRMRTAVQIVAAHFMQDSVGWRKVHAALAATQDSRSRRVLYCRVYGFLARERPSSLAARVVARGVSDVPGDRLRAWAQAGLWEVTSGRKRWSSRYGR
jgi:hypothetical protein